MNDHLPDETHDAALRAWVPGADDHSDFPIQNLPFGIFAPAGEDPRIGVAIGDWVLDLREAAARDLLPAGCRDAASAPRLNAVFALPAGLRHSLRRRLSDLLSSDIDRERVAPLLFDAASCTMAVPAAIGDYTDFFVGIHHARNIGSLFRPDNPLLPNYKYVPIGYHGRASSIRPSGVPVVRPNGQRKLPDEDAPSYGPCRRLDYELELGVWIGGGNALGSPIPIAKAGAHVAGFCLLNDWSARDIQTWEYQPLGPFLAKSFQTSISPWVVTREALVPFRVSQPARPVGDPPPLAYLWDEEDQRSGALGVTLDVTLASAAMRRQGMPPLRLSRNHATGMYWTVAQMIAHHTSNGCNLATGDLLGTGTLSGSHDGGCGSILEITHGGAKPIALPDGTTRSFLKDGDEIVMSARAEAEGRVTIGFGECRGTIVAAPGF